MLSVVTLILVFTYSLSEASTLHNEQGHFRLRSKGLSDQPHMVDGVHNAEYDHEAFLGKSLEGEFHHLSVAESKRRLGLIVDQIDTDHDGNVTEEEMTVWVRDVSRQHVVSDTKRVWAYFDKAPSNTLGWDEYVEASFGEFSEDQWPSKEEFHISLQQHDVDKRRFKLADTNSNGLLTFEEFTDFIHPEDASHMLTALVAEKIEDLDTDKDGFISVDEFVADFKSGSDSEEESQLLAKQGNEEFIKWRDHNKDGRLDEREVEKWIAPDDYDNSVAESIHLIHLADLNKDGVLSRREIIEKHDVFVGSRVTHYGQVIDARHEL